MRDRGAISRTTLATRFAIAMTLVVVITVIAVGWLNYRSLEQALLPRVLDRIEAHARLMATELESHAAGARRDVASYRFIPGFAGLIRARMAGGADPTDDVPVNVWRQRIAMHFIGGTGGQARLCNDPADRRRRQSARNRPRRQVWSGRRSPRRHRCWSCGARSDRYYFKEDGRPFGRDRSTSRRSALITATARRRRARPCCGSRRRSSHPTASRSEFSFSTST